MSKPRFVFDTNVIISAAILPRSIPRYALEKGLDLGELLMSTASLEELTEILIERSGLDRYASREQREGFLATLVSVAVFPDINESFQACRDPKDDKFLELAVAGVAACLITGDADLLVLDPFRGIPIVTPRKFLDEFPPGDSDQGRSDPTSEATGEATEDPR